MLKIERYINASWSKIYILNYCNFSDKKAVKEDAIIRGMEEHIVDLMEQLSNAEGLRIKNEYRLQTEINILKNQINVRNTNN